MKLLIIGIDGGDMKLLSKFKLPFFSALRNSLHQEVLEEDLWSRGWSKFISGLPGYETGAFYTKPDFDYCEGLRFTQRFNSKDYLSVGKDCLIWNAIQKMGYSVGIMNLPTTAPIFEDINGFMVTGAGGGLSQRGVAGVPLKACSTPEIKEILDHSEYIFDIRFRASGLKTRSSFLEALTKMQEARTKGFLQLNNRFDVEIGIIAYMSISRFQNLAYCDIEQSWNNSRESYTSIGVRSMYRSFDECLEKLVDNVKPDKVVVISDHGSVPRQGTININAFLKRQGFLFTRSYLREKIDYICGRILRRKIGSDIMVKRTTAFSWRYINGIYICDQRRFGGPVATDHVDALSDQIIELVNNDELFQELGVSARRYRSKYLGARQSDILPDIWIDKPDELFCERKGEIFHKNENYQPLGESLTMIKEDQYMGAKGRKPLFMMSPSLRNYIKPVDTKDLTLSNKVVLRYLYSLKPQSYHTAVN